MAHITRTKYFKEEWPDIQTYIFISDVDKVFAIVSAKDVNEAINIAAHKIMDTEEELGAAIDFIKRKTNVLNTSLMINVRKDNNGKNHIMFAIEPESVSFCGNSIPDTDTIEQPTCTECMEQFLAFAVHTFRHIREH